MVETDCTTHLLSDLLINMFRSTDTKIQDGGLDFYSQYTENKKIPPDFLLSVDSCICT